jgi:hypothetical protein
MATNYEIGQTFTPDDLRDMALQVAEHYDIPKDLFLGLNAHESAGWNPAAKNPKSSARGLGQFIDGTAKSYFDEPITNDENDPRNHPGKSLDASARYLRDLYGQHGDWEKAVLHYGENTPAYLNKIKEAAGREADEYEHFKQGQFMEVAGGADLGFGMSPAHPGPPRKQTGHMAGTVEGLHPQVMQQFDLMAQEFYEKTGEPLIIASGRRTTERQAELYAADPNSGYVAKPGTSKHETGEAIDLDRGQVKKIEELGLLEKYGFHRPMQGQGAKKVNEPWHIQLTDEFKQGQFMEVAGGADLGFGMSPVGQEAQPGALYQGVREYLGLNREPWKMSPVLSMIAADYMKTPATYPGMTQEEQETADLALAVGQAAPLGLSGEDLLFPGQRQKDIVESEAQRIMGRYVDGYTASLTEGGKQAAFGDTFMPETALGSALGQGAYLAGQIMGPFKLIKMLTGSYLFPTVEGLRTTSQILTAGMKEGAVNLGLLQGLSRVVPAMIEHDDFSKWAGSVLSDAKGGALVGAAFPLLSLVPGQGVVGAGLRIGTGFAAMDYMRAGRGKWTTLGDFYQAFQTWDEESKKQFAALSYSYLVDLYFANSVRPIRETMAAYNQNQILQEMAKLKPQELEKEILAVTGQQPPDALTELWKNRGAAGRLEQKVEAGQPIGEAELRQAQAQREGVQREAEAVQEEIGRRVDAGETVPPELWSRYRTLNELAQVSTGGEMAPGEARGERGPVTVETPQTVKDINPDVAASVEVAAPTAAPAPGPEGTKRPAEAVNPAEQPQPYKLYAGFPGPETGEVLARLKEGIREARSLWTDLKTNIREIVAPGTLPGAKEVAKGLITMMGRKNEAINQAHFRLLEFRDLFKKTPVSEWGALAATWQAGGKTGSDLDRAWEVYHEISEALVPRVRDFRDLAYQENYLRQAWRNSRDPEFKANIGEFLEGKPFKNYLDMDESGNPRLYKGTFAEDGSFTLERQEGVGELAKTPEERPKPLTSVPRGRTLTGGRGYFKEKKIPDWQTGLMLGGIPKFKNLFDLMVWDLGEKNQFVWGNTFIKWAREEGYLKYVTTREIPQGWARINDPRGLISHPYLKEIEAETRPFDQVPGEYDMTAPPKTEPRVLQHVLVAPAEAARIINNFLSPGLWGQPVYNLYRRVVDPLRRLGVSFSTFHLRFTMNNSLATGTGQALSKVMGDLFSGDVKGATQAVKSGAVNLTGSPFFMELRAGKGLTEAFYKGTDDPLLQSTLRRFIDTGGTLPAPESMLPMVREVGKGMWQSLVELGRVHPFRAVGELAEASSKPIMTYAVPFAKLGAFPVLDRALQDRLETKYAKMGPETPELAAQREAEYRQGLFDINKHLDNIYGQMNYDSLLLNRKIKDLLFFVIKFPGWNIGSGRWLAGKISGLRKIAGGQEVSEYERASLKSGLGFMVNMAIYNTLAYWFINGQPPEDIAELFSKGVWTGGYTRSGNKEYIRDASYWRDIWGMLPVGQHGGFEPGKPIETIKVKAADIWRVPVEVFDNKEAYSGHQILTPGEPSKWAEEGLKYLGKQATPYSFRGMAQATSPWGRFGSFIGWTPTPARLTDTPAMQEMRSHRQAEAPTMITTQQQGQREVKRDIMDFVYEGDGEGFLAALRRARSEGQITSSQYKSMVQDGHEILRDPHYGPLRNSFRKLNDLGVAIKVYGLAMPEEREALGTLMQQKWGNAQPETRRQHRQEFLELKARIAAGK